MTEIRRLAALYDIHGNLPALDAALEAAEAWSAELIVVGGDVVLGPMPRECLERVRGLDARARFIRGNADRMVVESAEGRLDTSRIPPAVVAAIAWVAGELSEEERRLLGGWPPTLSMRIAGVGDVLFCHATPRSDTEIFTVGTPADRVAPMLAGVSEPTVVCGHTHMAFDRTVNGVRVVNAGSVGMPFGEPGAHWLRLGPEVGLECTAYDLESAAERVRATSYPGAADFAARHVVQVPSAESMLAIYEGARPS